MTSIQRAFCLNLSLILVATCLFSLGCGASNEQSAPESAVAAKGTTEDARSLAAETPDAPVRDGIRESEFAGEGLDGGMAGGFGAQPSLPQSDQGLDLPESLADESRKEGAATEPDAPVASSMVLPADSAMKGEADGKDTQEQSKPSEEAPAIASRQFPVPSRSMQTSPGAIGGAARGGQPSPATPSPAGSGGRSLEKKESIADNQTAAAPLVFNLQPGEELWIIAKSADTQSRTANPDSPGCGALMATLPNETKQVPVPLKHTSVEGSIDGYIATVDVNQQFYNPYSSKIEAVYVFPLPDNAAVNEFVMTVGDRKIRGIIRERKKAEKIYAAARAQGYVAALMTQERANIFTQKVANIEPGKQIDIHIRYFNTLQYDDGSYEFVFPMVVGPRFNPAATTGGVGAVARGYHAASGQSTEVQYLAPNERSGHDVSVTLNISAGVDIEDIHCVNHAINEQQVTESQRKITLSSRDTIPNKDFVLRYKVAGTHIKTALLTHEDKQGKYFTMMLYPPADLAQVQRSPMEMVFVLDCSGSMNGKPMQQAKDAIRHAVQSLTPRDTFQIIQFSNNASQLGAEPLLATDDNIKLGLKYLESLNSTGGTQMIEGIKAALDFPHDEGRFRLVSFMTDGYIGNEQQILTAMHQKLGEARVFSFGVGSSPNRMLMDRMAMLCRGAVAYLSLNDDAIEIMERFNQRISHPAMTDLQIDWGNMDVADVYPQRLPDLIVGRPVVVTGRFKGEPSVVKINGRVAMEPASFSVALDETDASQEHAGVAAVWARLKIMDMMNVATRSPEAADEIRVTVLETALAHNLMSAFTAFVAVDSMTKTEGDFGTTVAVPVPTPEGVKYETTVGGNE